MKVNLLTSMTRDVFFVLLISVLVPMFFASDVLGASIYGDLYVIERDEDGLPIYVTWVDGVLVLYGDGDYVQPINYIEDPNTGDITIFRIPLDNEGEVAAGYEDYPVEVVLERLNLGRSPATVLSRALTELYALLSTADSITTDAAGRIVMTLGEETKAVESPRDNLALYVEFTEPGSLTDGDDLDWSFLPPEIKDAIADMSQLASLIAAASGKTTPIILDTVEYLNLILEVDGDGPLVDKFDNTYFDYITFAYNRAERFSQLIRYGTIDPCEETQIIYTISTLEEAVFGGTDTETVYNARGFAQAADDARAVILFMHDVLVLQWTLPVDEPYITEIEIQGPEIVGDNTADIAYTARAVWSDATYTAVTPVWAEDSDAATITQDGILTTFDVDASTYVEISAVVDVDGCPKEGTLAITVTDGNPAQMVIVDNLDTDQSQDAYVTSTGTWKISGGADAWPIPDGDSVYSYTVGDTFTFNANLIEARYAVYMRWTAWSSRESSVPVDIFSKNKPDAVGSVTVNQRTNPIRWNLLGVFELGAATKVIITSAGRSTNADAVMFMPVALDVGEGIIMDNSGPVATAAGKWGISKGIDPEGINSEWSRTVGSTYTYELKNLSGTFDIQAKWTNWASRYDAVPYEIYDGNATVPIMTVPVNQALNGGSFHLLASSVTFNDWVRIVIRVPAEIGKASINADAIKLLSVAKAIGSVQIEWESGSKGKSDKYAFADFKANDEYGINNSIGEFSFRVTDLNGKAHRIIDAQITDSFVSTAEKKAWFVGTVVSDTKGCAGTIGGGHSSDCGGSSGDHTDSSDSSSGDDGHDGGCSGGSSGGCGGGGGSGGSGKDCRMGQLIAIKLHDGGTPGKGNDGITWKWFESSDTAAPVIENLNSWPQLCKKEILSGNIVVHG